MQSIIEHCAEITRSGTLRVPGEIVENLAPGTVFFHPGKFDGKTSGQDFPNCPQGFYMVCDPRFDDCALCISWDPADWVGEGASYDPDEDRSDCLKDGYLDLSDCALFDPISVLKSDRVVPIAQDVDVDEGPENARLLVNAIVDVLRVT